MLGQLLDRSIVFSFDRTGYRRHAAAFPPGELETDQRGRVAVVTGASSGLGVEIARGLMERGATVILACRDVEKGERVRASLPSHTGSSRVQRLDVSDFESIRAFAASLDQERVDVLVHSDTPTRLSGTNHEHLERARIIHAYLIIDTAALPIYN